MSNVISCAVSALKIAATLPVAVVGFLILSWKYEESDDPIVINKTGTPVLLLHGSNANQKQWYLFRKYLDKNVAGHVFAVNMNSAGRCDDHDRDILDYAHTVHNKIIDLRSKYKEAGLNMDSIILVGNSMGGLVAGAYCTSEYMEKDVNTVKINAVITISTPWGGAPLADYFCDRDVYPQKYFCTDSIDRKNLVEKVLTWSNEQKIPIYNYGSKFDLLVPISYSLLPLPENQLLLDNRNDHWTTMLDPKLASEIADKWITPHTIILDKALLEEPLD
jgi:pimeloyl-ACP methyl ester carboxylesterase